MPSEDAIVWLADATFVICSSVENEAIWPMNSPSAIGFIGSWCCSWATKSLRKSSLPSDFCLVAWLPAVGVPAPAIGVVVMVGASGQDVHEDAVGEGEP